MFRFIFFFSLCFFPTLSFATTASRDNQLLQKYAPVWIQEIAHEPIHDIITRWNFDGNVNGADNVEHAESFPLPAAVYGSVLAETIDAYYLFYGVYHVRDYDSLLREFFWASSSHDNDFEGAMVVVAKPGGEILAVETWFHSIFLQFTHSPKNAGNQAIDGKIHLEDFTHPILYVQAKGHGVRAFQKIDEALLRKRSHKIYRLGSPTLDVKQSQDQFVSYELISLEPFFQNAQGPFEEKSMLAEPAEYNLLGKPLGKYLSGRFKGDSAWARPKPPWSWADKFDDLRVGAWFFHPAYVVNQHFGLRLSEQYIRNSALEKFFPEQDRMNLNAWAAQVRDDSFFPKAPQGVFFQAYRACKKWLYKLIEPLFFEFG